MANQERNGRNVAVPDENRPSWRPQDENQRNRRSMSDSDDRDWDDDDRSIERYGQGQSGYAAGRYEGDRSYGSRNQAVMSDHARDRGSDERFAGGRGGQMWSPDDRGDRGMQGSSSSQHGNYGHSGHWTDERGGPPMGYSNARQDWDMQSARAGGHGVQGQGGMYGQGGYNEGMYGRGGQQDRYGSQGYGQQNQQHNRYAHRTIGEERYSHRGQHGYGQGFGQAGSEQGGSGSGYGHQPEHEMGFGGDHQAGRGPQRVGLVGDDFSHEQMYGRQRPSHRGKGPSGYTRSDERIREMVCDVLTDHDDIDASHIEITVKNGEVTLAGTVEDRRTKRMAEDVIENLSGVKDVVNQIRVTDRHQASAKKDGGPAVEKSPPEQALQSGNDKRHRA